MRLLALLAVLSVASGPALASPNCTSEPKAKWLSESAIKEKIASLGYTYKVFKVTTGNCYEIYGQDKTGKRVEIYFHPMTGVLVEEHKS